VLESILAEKPAERSSLFADMNSFFASVEQQVDPSLRGRPVGICPFVHDSTSVIAASIEAKRFGVKTGTSVVEARRLCPDIVLIGDGPSRYRDYHKQIMATLQDTRCQVYVRSIDEALLVIPKDMRSSALGIAHDVKARIWDIGDQLNCSIGIASNQFLSKMASNFKKPNGLTVVDNQDIGDFYSQLRLTDLHGISWRMARRLNALDIYTPLDFWVTPYAKLRQAFGSSGQAWYLRLRGYEVDQRPTKRRTIGHQATITPKPADSVEDVLGIASQLVTKAALRMRSSGYAAYGVMVALRFTDRSWWQEVYKGKVAFSDSASFYGHVRRLLETAPVTTGIRLVSITAFDLLPSASMPAMLFDTASRDERISQAMDLIETRFGRRTIMTAREMIGTPVSDRIGFGNSVHMTTDLPKP
jgi:DNA polymerase IV